MKLSVARLLAAIVALVVIAFAAPAALAHRGHHGHHGHHPHFLRNVNPMIFVHGGAGSAGQFESQGMRFTSNGYRPSFIRVVEYDSTFGLNTREEVLARIDAAIADAQQDTGRAKVDVLGHSLGTTLMHSYLSTPARAANIAHYVNIDGRTAASPPGGVPTLALWAGRGTPGREIVGATNVTLPNQTHVQCATSKEAFVEMFKFFTGKSPKTDITRERRIKLSGRAQLFPQNTGADGTTLQVWEVNRNTGRRKHKHPLATQAIGADGAWGPIHARAGRHYEFALVRSGGLTHHLYYEPFTHSDRLVRLLTNVPGQGIDVLLEKSPNHTGVLAVRYKELWGDQGAENDVLTIDGASVLNAATAPINKRVIAMFAFDAGSDGISNVATPLPVLFSLPFLSGVDLFIPAANPANRTVAVTLRSRGAGPVRTVNFPNFRSTTDQVSVQLNDFE